MLLGSFTGTGPTTQVWESPEPNSKFNFTLWGTFTGSVQLERSFNGGTDWHPITILGTPLVFTGPCSEQLEEIDAGVDYRINCTALSSGTINYRLS